MCLISGDEWICSLQMFKFRVNAPDEWIPGKIYREHEKGSYLGGGLFMVQCVAWSDVVGLLAQCMAESICAQFTEMSGFACSEERSG